MRPSWAVFYCVKQHLSTVGEWSESVRKCLETVVDLDLMLVVSTGRLCSLNLSLRRHLVSSIYCKWQRLHWTMLITFWVLQVIWEEMEAVYKSGTGTRGRGHRDACVGTWDLGTRGEGLEDIKYGTQGRQIQGRRGRGMWIIIAKVGGKCVTFLVNMFWWRQPTLSSLGFLQACLGSEDSSKTPSIKEVKPLSWSSCWWNIGAQSRVRCVAVTKIYVE